MSEAPKTPGLRVEGFAKARADKLYPIPDYIASIGNRVGVQISDNHLRKILKTMLGVPTETVTADMDTLIPADHPLRGHLRFVDGKLFLDKYVCLKLLEALYEEWKDHKYSTVRTTAKKIAQYIEILKTELAAE